MTIINRKTDVAEYPMVTRKMLAQKLADQHTIGDYHSAMVTLPEVTCESVQEVFATLYAQHDADPKYLFIAEEDLEPLSRSIMRTLVQQRATVTQIVNQATQRFVYIVPLPALPQGTVFCGFFG